MQTDHNDNSSEYTPSQADKEALIDLSAVSIDCSLPTMQRLKQYLQQVKDPYCVRVGDVTVELRFFPASNIEDRIKEYLRNAVER